MLVKFHTFTTHLYPRAHPMIYTDIWRFIHDKRIWTIHHLQMARKESKPAAELHITCTVKMLMGFTWNSTLLQKEANLCSMCFWNTKEKTLLQTESEQKNYTFWSFLWLIHMQVFSPHICSQYPMQNYFIPSVEYNVRIREREGERESTSSLSQLYKHSFPVLGVSILYCAS